MALTISARELGAVADPAACPRCLWVKLHVSRLPYQTFPGIFSSIDSYTKRLIHAYLEREGRLPAWMAQVGDVVGDVASPSYQAFSVLDQASGLTLRGTADAIFRLRGGDFAIVDYKTARYTPGQGALFPLYTTQLNAYAYIGERVGLFPVSRLALVYMEPVTDQATAQRPSIAGPGGFDLGFSARVVPVELTAESTIPPLLQRARAVYDLPGPPASSASCKDCAAVRDLIAAWG